MNTDAEFFDAIDKAFNSARFQTIEGKEVEFWRDWYRDGLARHGKRGGSAATYVFNPYTEPLPQFCADTPWTADHFLRRLAERTVNAILSGNSLYFDRMSRATASQNKPDGLTLAIMEQSSKLFGAGPVSVPVLMKALEKMDLPDFDEKTLRRRLKDFRRETAGQNAPRQKKKDKQKKRSV